MAAKTFLHTLTTACMVAHAVSSFPTRWFRSINDEAIGGKVTR